MTVEQRHFCPDCLWEIVPAPWMKCVECAAKNVAAWKAARTEASRPKPRGKKFVPQTQVG